MQTLSIMGCWKPSLASHSPLLLPLHQSHESEEGGWGLSLWPLRVELFSVLVEESSPGAFVWGWAEGSGFALSSIMYWWDINIISSSLFGDGSTLLCFWSQAAFVLEVHRGWFLVISFPAWKSKQNFLVLKITACYVSRHFSLKKKQTPHIYIYIYMYVCMQTEKNRWLWLCSALTASGSWAAGLLHVWEGRWCCKPGGHPDEVLKWYVVVVPTYSGGVSSRRWGESSGGTGVLLGLGRWSCRGVLGRRCGVADCWRSGRAGGFF